MGHSGDLGPTPRPFAPDRRITTTLGSESLRLPGPTVAERYQYLYSEDELREWVPATQGLARQPDRVHVLFNNCYRDYGARTRYLPHSHPPQ